MEDIIKSKLDHLRVYQLLQRMEHYLEEDSLGRANEEFESFIEIDENLLRLFCYFTRPREQTIIPRKVASEMDMFVCPAVIARFIRRVPTSVLRYPNTYIDGPCNLAFMIESMFRAHYVASWYTYDKTHSCIKSSLNYVKLKFPNNQIDI